ncbi:MAG: S9 family peptidase, partial [Verrucomicrobia bacterium]|nr:S9 family peptidase [Verrucomicrobiota bacterium]
MKSFLLSVCAFMFIPIASVVSQSVPPIIPIRDFFRNPETTGYQLSSTGDFIAFLKPVANRLNVFVQPRDGGTVRQISHVKDRDIRNFFWKGDKFILYVRDNGGDENFHLYVSPIDGSREQDLTPFDKVRAEIVDDLEDHPTDVLVGLNKREKEVFDVYRLNVETGEMNLVAENPGNVASWVTDHEGKIRLATTSDGVNTSILYRKSESGPWTSVLTTNFRETFSPQFFTFDNKELYGVSNIGRDKAAIVQ